MVHIFDRYGERVDEIKVTGGGWVMPDSLASC